METTRNVSLRILIDRKAKRVLFAEAEKDFVDFLFQIFSLPLASVVNILSKENMVGCLGELYGSIENFNDNYMQLNANKDNALNPKISICAQNNSPLLLPKDSSVAATRRFYRCPSEETYDSNRNRYIHNSCNVYVSDNPETICPTHKTKLTKEITYLPAIEENTVTSIEEGGYVKGVVTYMIMDDLEIKPMSSISSLLLLSMLNIKDLGALEEKVVDLTPDEVLKLLKASLQSKTVLTDVFLTDVFLDVSLKEVEIPKWLFL